MSFTVFLLDDAEQDLWNIHTYIHHQFSEALADRIYQDIRDGILLLEKNPQLGTVIAELAALGMSSFRQMVVMKKNRVVYELDTKQQHVYVYLICTERQDYETVLRRRILHC